MNAGRKTKKVRRVRIDGKKERSRRRKKNREKK